MIRRENTLFVVFQNRKLSTIILAFCWFAGLLTGCFFADHAGNIHFSMMRRAVSGSVSIAGLVVVLLPFLFTAIAVYLSRTWLFLPFCFFRAFRFAYVAGLVSGSFGASGWLVRLLLLFTDGCQMPVLLWIWFRWIGNGGRKAVHQICVCAILSAVVWGIDYFVVSPFLGMLI